MSRVGGSVRNEAGWLVVACNQRTNTNRRVGNSGEQQRLFIS